MRKNSRHLKAYRQEYHRELLAIAQSVRLWNVKEMHNRGQISLSCTGRKILSHGAKVECVRSPTLLLLSSLLRLVQNRILQHFSLSISSGLAGNGASKA